FLQTPHRKRKTTHRRNRSNHAQNHHNHQRKAQRGFSSTELMTVAVVATAEFDQSTMQNSFQIYPKKRPAEPIGFLCLLRDDPASI
ncbi:hypothetical protein, partial [Agrobacterium larrymoorei]|uniref:hypothetical protein n=1 Tax=Agrobacterium larrymoorei TaxID=160699 RepID=UPI001AED6F65